MKILHVIPSLSLAHGGPSRAIRLIAQVLQSRGVAVEIATTDDDGPGKRMEIVARVNSLPTCGGGGGKYKANCLALSCRNGAGVQASHWAGWGGEACGLEPRAEAGTNRVPLPASPTSGGGVDQQRVAVCHYFPKRTEFYKVSPGFARWVFRHVRDYDVVHIHALFSFTSMAAAWAARSAGVPYVVRPLGTLAQYGVTQRRPWLKRLSLKFIEGPILRHAAAVHFTAEAEKAEAEALGIAMRGVVIPLGVEVVVASHSQPTPQVGEELSTAPPLPTSPMYMEQTPTANPLPTLGEGWGGECLNPLLAKFPQLAGKPIVLFLSRLDAKKNVEGLLKAFSLLASEYPNLHLLIAGDGEPAYVARLKTLAKNLGLADCVTWAGHLDGEMKASAFAAASVFALPSFSENFGIAAAEALLAGLPCVLGKGVAIADDVVQAGAGLAVLPEPEEIARALRTILDDESLRSGMGHRAAVLAGERYSLEAMGERLVELYEGIIDKRGQKDYRAAAKVLDRAHKGQEKVFSSDVMRKDLDLDD